MGFEPGGELARDPPVVYSSKRVEVERFSEVHTQPRTRRLALPKRRLSRSGLLRGRLRPRAKVERQIAEALKLHGLRQGR